MRLFRSAAIAKWGALQYIIPFLSAEWSIFCFFPLWFVVVPILHLYHHINNERKRLKRLASNDLSFFNAVADEAVKCSADVSPRTKIFTFFIFLTIYTGTISTPIYDTLSLKFDVFDIIGCGIFIVIGIILAVFTFTYFILSFKSKPIVAFDTLTPKIGGELDIQWQNNRHKMIKKIQMSLIGRQKIGNVSSKMKPRILFSFTNINMIAEHNVKLMLPEDIKPSFKEKRKELKLSHL